MIRQPRLRPPEPADDIITQQSSPFRAGSLLLIKPVEMFPEMLDGLECKRHSLPEKVLAKKLKALINPPDISFIGMFFKFQCNKAFVQDLYRPPQLPACRCHNQDIIHITHVVHTASAQSIIQYF